MSDNIKVDLNNVYDYEEFPDKLVAAVIIANPLVLIAL